MHHIYHIVTDELLIGHLYLRCLHTMQRILAEMRQWPMNRRMSSLIILSISIWHVCSSWRAACAHRSAAILLPVSLERLVGGFALSASSSTGCRRRID